MCEKRWLGVALCVFCVALVGGCGADDELPTADLPDTLGYMPRDASAVAIVPTDLEGDQLRRLHRLLEPLLGEAMGDAPLSEVVASLLFDESVDMESLTGGTLVVSLGNADEDTPLVVLEARDGERAAKVLREQELGRASRRSTAPRARRSAAPTSRPGRRRCSSCPPARSGRPSASSRPRPRASTAA